ncbi:methylmalonyl-CoA mutase family protein [Fibrella aquatilis]|uniref:Methylmalonyl-CoA mutase n=1 Tax=Fibrella aquatilis TaxID=2817059 RepID=A0A939G941_9BACT|nr:methylmalonyl-CoA mutase family protein [Fibrella aquatilis]MBO0934722.1 methylmalonyl-CoA mutase [Fibrella aquatilis]
MPTSFSAPFPAATHADWLAQVQKDLKDPNAYESLRWPTPEGFTAEPYYTAEQLASLPLAQIQAVQKSAPGWLNTPFYAITDEKTDNATLRDALASGAEALVLQLRANADLPHLLAGIKLSDTPVFFHVEGDIVVFLERLRQLAPYQLRGGIMTHHANLPEAHTLTADSPLFRIVTINGGAFHHAGATATQELAFTLAQLADMYDSLTASGLAVDQLVPKTTITLAVGTSYFMEIAKLRALRVLLARFTNAYALSSPTSFPPFFLTCTTSPFYEATATPYTNLLRATTEAMAAVIGGCDALSVRPYNAVLNAQNEFSHRIARNVSVLLKAESYLDKVADPSAGSYYIESLTHQLIEAAWTLFLQVESIGGFAKAAETGFIKNELDAAYQAKIQAVTNGRTLVGVTKFRHDEGEQTKPASQSIAQSEGDFTGLNNRRLAESFE